MLMQTGWIQAGLRSDLFATQSIITHKKQAEFTGFKKQPTVSSILENYPAFKGLMLRMKKNSGDGSAYYTKHFISVGNGQTE